MQKERHEHVRFALTNADVAIASSQGITWFGFSRSIHEARLRSRTEMSQENVLQPASLCIVHIGRRRLVSIPAFAVQSTTFFADSPLPNRAALRRVR